MDRLDHILGHQANDEPMETESYSSFYERYEFLSAFLCCQEHGGRPRKTGSLTLFSQDGVLKARFWDNETHMVGWYSVENPADSLAELNDALSAGKIDWRQEKSSKKESNF